MSNTPDQIEEMEQIAFVCRLMEYPVDARMAFKDYLP